MRMNQTNVPFHHIMATYSILIIIISIILCTLNIKSIIAQFDDLSSLNEHEAICIARYAKYNSNHTACVPPNRSCRITHDGINKQDRKLIVDVHNYFRNLIASGNESNLGFPSASDMLRMEWDNELAYVAQMHANQCKFAHDCNTCRRTGRNQFVGQNLYVYQSSRTTVNQQWRFVIKEWYDEIKIAPPIVANSFDLFNLNIGHFTQIAWASTNRIGCGYVTYDLSGSEAENSIFKTGQLYTCNYAPGGNFLGEPMYGKGRSASRCPTRHRRSKRFTSLCELNRVTNKSNKKNRIGNNNRNHKHQHLENGIELNSPIPTVSTTSTTIGSTTSLSTPLITNATIVIIPPSSHETTISTPKINIPTISIGQHQPTYSNEIPETTYSLRPYQTIDENRLLQKATTPTTTTPTTTSTSTTTSTTTPSTTTTTTTTTKRISIKPKWTTKPETFSSSKRVTNWWDKWSENFGNTNKFASNSNTNRLLKSTKPTTVRTTTTTRKPFWKWSNLFKNKWERTASPVSWTPGPITSTRYLRFEMSHNGITTHRIDQYI
ncbi:hypothetical protein RDWZM_010601 [Blomia tropicalis]|uniref:SCP domain-containing protein n=1 Tax=Blomia tropicalis TaxID=40697 RepID=A0A9Q0RK96_BLOTA|nr:hypothetical protein RDWZM_010601 [Blomia tropicalis]